MAKQLLTETATTLTAEAVKGSSGDFLIQLITPGWGSSGYYGKDVLEAAGKNGVFPAGTHMYVNHQTAEERNNRPEGDLMGLAAVLQEDAYWTGDALVAKARPFQHWSAVLGEMKDAIGVSIRASAEISEGEAEDRRGIIVDELIAAESVDFVTRAGRGGKILQVLESAHAAAQDHPVSSAGATTETLDRGNTVQIDDARYAQLNEAAGQVPTLIAERDTLKARAEKAEADLAEARKAVAQSAAITDATARATTAATEAKLPPLAVDRVVKEATRDLPMRDDALDVAAFDAKLAESVKFEADYLAAFAPQSIAGFGASGDITEAAPSKPTATPWGRPVNGKVA